MIRRKFWKAVVAYAITALLLGLTSGQGSASGDQASSPTRILPVWDKYIEMPTKQLRGQGVVYDESLMVWGPDSFRTNGDAYSPVFISMGIPNPWHDEMPYGYLYRVDVPPQYEGDHLQVEIFDPDAYNRDDQPAPYDPKKLTVDMMASCSNPRPGDCTTDTQPALTGHKNNAFESGRPAFWRVDEYWTSVQTGYNNLDYDPIYATETQYTLWHFDPQRTDIFSDPQLLSDQPGGSYLARYSARLDPVTDLRWYSPPGFNVALRDGMGADLFARDADGGFSFYVYVQSLQGSSENSFDLRAGWPESNGGGCVKPCYINELNFTGAPDWESNGVVIFASRALPLNSFNADNRPHVFNTVSRDLAGQTMGVRHFDQDCSIMPSGCGDILQYQMQICGCDDLMDDSCWADVATGLLGPTNGWSMPGAPDPEQVPVPEPGTKQYSLIFGDSGQCSQTRLRLERGISYNGNSMVWETPFLPLRPFGDRQN